MKFLKPFFYSQNKFQPIYFWATIYLLLIAVGIILKYLGIHNLSDALIIGLCGFISILITCYNIFKPKDNSKGGSPDGRQNS